MTGSRSLTLMLLMVGFVASALHGQSKSKPRVQMHSLRFEKVPKVERSTADSFVTVKAESHRAAVTMVFDNPCGWRPRGQYGVAADTLFFLIRYKTDLPESAVCPGVHLIEAFTGVTDTIPAGRYTLRIVVEQGNRDLRPRVYRGKFEIQ